MDELFPSMQATLRPVAPDDLERFADMQPLLDAWRQAVGDPEREAALLDLTGGPLAPFADQLVIVEPIDTEHFRYTHYGAQVAQNASKDISGMSTEDFEGHVAEFFRTSYHKAITLREPLYSINRAVITHHTHVWQRLLLPLCAGGPADGHVIALMRPLMGVRELLADFARDTGLIGGTLEPVYDNGRVTDYLLQSLSDLGDVFIHKVPLLLSELQDRPLTDAEIDLILSASDGAVVMRHELPRSVERFGRAFMLRISGGRLQPVFTLNDETQLIEALNAAETQKHVLQDFVETASDWLWESDAEHLITYLSDSFEKETNSRTAQYIGKSRLNFADFAANADAFETHKKDLAARRPFRDLIYQLPVSDGPNRWIRVSGVPRFDEDGVFIGYRGTGSNISAEIEARKLAEARQEELEEFAAASPDWLWETDINHRFTMMGEAVTVHSGFPVEFYIGRSRADLENAFLDEDVLAAHLEDLKARRPFRDFIIPARAADGSPRYWRSHGNPRFDENGAFIGYRGTVGNITAEVEAKKALEQQRAAMEDFASVASDWMWETGPDHRFTMVGDAVYHRSGYPKGHYLGKSRLDFGKLAENAGRFEEHRADLEAKRPFKDFVYCSMTADDRIRWSRVSGRPIFADDGSFLGYRGTGSNITTEVEAKQELERQKTVMEEFADTASDWMWEIDETYIFTMMSRAIEKVTGSPSERYLGVNWFDLEDVPENRGAFAQMRSAMNDRSDFRNLVYKAFTDDGRAYWVRASGRPRLDEHGMFCGYRGTATDVTEEVEARKLARQQSRELDRAYRAGRLGAWWYDRSIGRVHLTESLRDLVGLGPEHQEMTVRRFMALFDRASIPDIFRAHREVLGPKGEGQADVRWRLPDGTYKDFSVVGRVERDDAGRVTRLLGTVQDISRRKRAERELERMAYHDSLTELGNRAAFNRALDALFEPQALESTKFGLLLLDLDNFKEVNDTLGHAAGDELLRVAAGRISSSVGGNARVFRLGGDEFAVIAPDIASPIDLSVLGSAIQDGFTGTIQLQDGTVHVTTSIGMVNVPQQTEDPTEAMRFADLALYRAKELGRDRHVLFHKKLDASVRERFALETDLRQAMRADDLAAHFQVQVDIRNRKISGFEALVRWSHPGRGMIPPGQFIPLAEASPMIGDIGAMMLKKACTQGRNWLDAGGEPISMAVNVSVAQLWHRDVAADVREALHHSGFPAELLSVELTESVFEDASLPRIQSLFADLKELGVCIALDDFGTGYSSLKYLDKLSFDRVKIDRSFVHKCDQDAEKRRLLQGIVGLSSGLGLQTIVEGVENEAELKVVEDMGCDMVQGFFFAKPGPFHEACLDAARIEAEYHLRPKLWRTDTHSSGKWKAG